MGLTAIVWEELAQAGREKRLTETQARKVVADLLTKALEAQEQAIGAEQRAVEANGGELPPLSTAEINEIYGGPSTILE